MIFTAGCRKLLSGGSNRGQDFGPPLPGPSETPHEGQARGQVSLHPLVVSHHLPKAGPAEGGTRWGARAP